MKVNFKRISIYGFVILILVFCIFMCYKFFGFEKTKSQKINVTNTMVNELYNYLPKGEMFNHGFYYNDRTNFDNISIEEVVYKYIEKYNSSALKKISQEDVKKYKFNFKNALYFLSEKDYKRIGQKIFGADIKFAFGDFNISNSLKAKYIDKEGFIIYGAELQKDNDNYIIDSLINKYVIKDNGKTIVIYDNYVICNKDTGICYNSEKKDVENDQIKYYNGKTNLKGNLVSAGLYKHIFKYNDGKYYWFESYKCN